MDLTLSSEQDAVRKAVKTWVDDVVSPRALQNDREERFPQEALDGLRQTGFIGLSIPGQYGGGDGDPLSYVLPFIWTRLGMKIGNTINDRSLNLDLYQGFEETTVDLYSAVRNVYLQRRRLFVLRGREDSLLFRRYIGVTMSPRGRPAAGSRCCPAWSGTTSVRGR